MNAKLTLHPAPGERLAIQVQNIGDANSRSVALSIGVGIYDGCTVFLDVAQAPDLAEQLQRAARDLMERYAEWSGCVEESPLSSQTVDQRPAWSPPQVQEPVHA